jgi:PhzF family phenazine biosynthesis protein
MVVPYFEILAFTRHFGGNPAGVCLLNGDWLTDGQMQQIAWQNNLAETAFVVSRKDDHEIRWFSPTMEIDLCGHATLASAYVLFEHVGGNGASVKFRSQAGELRVDRTGKRLTLDFPAIPLQPRELQPAVEAALGATPLSVWKARDLYAVLDKQETVANFKPDFEALSKIDDQGVVITAPGEDCDFVSRYFAPNAGIPEDPVTGSTHCCLIPFWSGQTGKKTLYARQLSARGGELFCQNRDNRVGIGGDCVTYLEGKLHFE